ncbi:MAG: imidazole glycerol phosphate synthase subunit HisH [Kiritimatiellae bacterium]|nr:imidazole glycerol phosphate synthase subunit HisH [Kiritimatiellia bacterium]
MIAIVDYKAGNLTSVQLAFRAIGHETVVTSDISDITSADRVVFPGVGAAGSAMRHLTDLGLLPAIKAVVAHGTPFLGICLGTQILLDHSEEDNGVETLGIICGRTQKFTPSDPWQKVPQIGWNRIRIEKKHPLLENIEDGSEFYFVHSYYPAPAAFEDVLCTTDYADISFASMLGRGNVAATQFHPEKSGRIGLRLLENFTRWNPKTDLN